MTRDEQIKFIVNLTGAIRDKMLRFIDEGRVPEDWDGHELRQLLADLFMRERTGLNDDHRSRRYRAYEQTRCDNELW